MKQKFMPKFQENEIILRQGDNPQEMYKVLSGKVAVYLHYGTPEEYLIGILSEQRCFGEFSLLCGKPSIYTVVAISEVLVLRIREESFDDFIKNNPKNAIAIMKNLANMVNTLSLNLNMLKEDLNAISNEKNNPQKIEDITLWVRQHAALNTINKALFSEFV